VQVRVGVLVRVTVAVEVGGCAVAVGGRGVWDGEEVASAASVGGLQPVLINRNKQATNISREKHFRTICTSLLQMLYSR
jgi:hypothetical protein